MKNLERCFYPLRTGVRYVGAPLELRRLTGAFSRGRPVPPSRRRVAALRHTSAHLGAKSLRRSLLQTLTMEAMVLGPQALLSAAMNPVLSADFSPVPAALQRRKPELQGLKTAVAVLRGSPLVKLPHELLRGDQFSA